MEFAKGVSVSDVEFNIKKSNNVSQGREAEQVVCLSTGVLSLSVFCTL